MTHSKQPTCLILFHPGMEEVEALTPVDLLRRAGIAVTTANLGEGIHVEGRNGITVHADTTLEDVDPASFDAVLLPGGPGIQSVRKDNRVLDLLRAADRRKTWIAAICAAPVVLHEAGILQGRHFTGHEGIAGELADLDPAQVVVVDGHTITSRGAGTAIPFSLAVIEMLKNTQTSKEVALSIHWDQ